MSIPESSISATFTYTSERLRFLLASINVRRSARSGSFVSVADLLSSYFLISSSFSSIYNAPRVERRIAVLVTGVSEPQIGVLFQVHSISFILTEHSLTPLLPDSLSK